MAELMVLFQALLLIAGWLLFLRAQTELRAQAARQSLTGELESLRQTVDALLIRLIEESERAQQRLQALQRWAQETQPPPPSMSPSAPTQCPEPNPPPTLSDTLESPTPMETFAPDLGYNSTRQERPSVGALVQLAREGLSVAEIARKTGYAPGEVELILKLKQRHLEAKE